MKDFENNNRIIAEFMRGKPSPPNWTWDYHETWDSLIPVVEKILRDEKGMIYLSAPNFVPGNEDSTFSLLTCADNNIRKKGDDFFKMVYESVIEYLKNRPV